VSDVIVSTEPKIRNFCSCLLLASSFSPGDILDVMDLSAFTSNPCFKTGLACGLSGLAVGVLILLFVVWYCKRKLQLYVVVKVYVTANRVCLITVNCILLC